MSYYWTGILPILYLTFVTQTDVYDLDAQPVASFAALDTLCALCYGEENVSDLWAQLQSVSL